MEYKAIISSEEKTLTEEEVINIIGSKEELEIAKESNSFSQDDIEIFFE